MLGLACAPHVINNILNVKDAKTFKWAPLVAFGIHAIVMFLLKFAGIAGIVLVNDVVVTLPKVTNASEFIFGYGNLQSLCLPQSCQQLTISC
jgi:hypothetical protein